MAFRTQSVAKKSRNRCAREALERSICKKHNPLLFLVWTSNALFVLTLHLTDWVNFGLLVFRRRVTTRRLLIVQLFYSDIPHVCLKVVVQVPCRSKFYRDTNQCRGPATLTIKVWSNVISAMLTASSYPWFCSLVVKWFYSCFTIVNIVSSTKTPRLIGRIDM